MNAEAIGARALAEARPEVFWLDRPERPEPSPCLDTDLDADLVVVGGGFTGLWTALTAAEADPGRSIVVLEADTIGLRRVRPQRWVLRSLAHPRTRERRRPLARRGRHAPPPRRREPAGTTRRHLPPRHRLLTGVDRCAERGRLPVAGRLPGRQRLAPRGTRPVRDPAGYTIHPFRGGLAHLPGWDLAPRRRGDAGPGKVWPGACNALPNHSGCGSSRTRWRDLSKP